MSGIYDYSTTPVDNGNVLAGGTISIAEGCPAGNLNNAQRQQMADLASFIAAPTVGPTTGSTAVFSGEVVAGLLTTRTGSVGYSQIYPGSSTLTGNISFFSSAGTIQGYVGNASSGQPIPLYSSTGAGWNFANGPLTVGGSAVWTAANLTNLSQLANGPGYITSVSGTLGYTPANKGGDTFTGAIRRDTNFYMDIVGGSPAVVFDVGDYIYYDRTNNKFVFVINNVGVASIDANNIRGAGNIQGGLGGGNV